MQQRIQFFCRVQGSQIIVTAHMRLTYEDLWHGKATTALDHFLAQLGLCAHINFCKTHTFVAQQGLGGCTVGTGRFRVNGYVQYPAPVCQRCPVTSSWLSRCQLPMPPLRLNAPSKPAARSAFTVP